MPSVWLPLRQCPHDEGCPHEGGSRANQRQSAPIRANQGQSGPIRANQGPRAVGPQTGLCTSAGRARAPAHRGWPMNNRSGRRVNDPRLFLRHHTRLGSEALAGLTETTERSDQARRCIRRRPLWSIPVRITPPDLPCLAYQGTGARSARSVYTNAYLVHAHSTHCA